MGDGNGELLRPLQAVQDVQIPLWAMVTISLPPSTAGWRGSDSSMGDGNGSA